MNRTDLQNLALIRLEEAKTLLDNKHYSGAYYLCGYAVECALKACIAKRTQQYDFPDKETVQKSWVHDPEKLLIVADLDKNMKVAGAETRSQWAIVVKWNESTRYTTKSQQEAQEIYDATADDTTGVLAWIKQYW